MRKIIHLIIVVYLVYDQRFYLRFSFLLSSHVLSINFVSFGFSFFLFILGFDAPFFHYVRCCLVSTQHCFLSTNIFCFRFGFLFQLIFGINMICFSFPDIFYADGQKIFV